MKTRAILLISAILICITSTSAYSWCWLRDTGKFDCVGGNSLVNCCSGNLQVWQNDTMELQISTSTSDLLLAHIREGYQAWNNVEMSTFVFQEGGRTSQFAYQYDNTNTFNIDATFCTHYPAYCNQGILGFSGSWTSSSLGYHTVENDVIFNGEEFIWGDGSGGTIDVVGVTLHELGHSLGVTHPGDICRSSGSSGCGPESLSATMYYSYSGGQPTDKGTLELDDVASVVYGYPRSTFRVKVVDGSGTPISGATVELLGTAAPANGSSISEGGKVLGDVNNSSTRFGDKVASTTYINQTPFDDTAADGTTNYIAPVHRSFQIKVTSGAVIDTFDITVADGSSTEMVTLLDCTFFLNPSSASIDSMGGSDSFQVIVDPGCVWSASVSSGNSWLQLDGASSGSGNGAIDYLVSQNAGVARNGTITVNGQIFTLSQETGDVSCSYSISPDHTSFDSEGGAGSFALSCNKPTCPWTVVVDPDSNWINLTSSVSGTGDSTISFSATPNKKGERLGHIQCGGETFTVEQAGNVFPWPVFLPGILTKEH